MQTVLIVDDEYGLAEMAGELLSLAGYQVMTAINGKLALEILAHTRPDAILLDVMMPIMSGPELLERLKADDVMRAVPVIMMSAAGHDWLPDGSRPSVAGYLQKPFTYDQLMTALRAALPEP
jgi:CheY-like chemotaxis protein